MHPPCNLLRLGLCFPPVMLCMVPRPLRLTPTMAAGNHLAVATMPFKVSATFSPTTPWRKEGIFLVGYFGLPFCLVSGTRHANPK